MQTRQQSTFQDYGWIDEEKSFSKCPNPGAGTVQLAEDFLEFFTCKMFDNRSQLASICLQTVHTLDGPREQLCKVSVFTGIRLDAAHRIVFDQLPISLVKVNFDTLAATLATIIILSLESGSEPANFKHVVVTPLLNTSKLYPDSVKKLPANIKLTICVKVIGAPYANTISPAPRM